MSRFYLKTSDASVAGPFTGIELREAALAELLSPDTGVAGTENGPWLRAADVGLFSVENTPLPHPAGTKVPEFRVAGVNEAFEGPYKLRELIDFATRGILPAEASLQPVGRPDWVPVHRISILNSCLRGELSRASTAASSYSNAAASNITRPRELTPDFLGNTEDQPPTDGEPGGGAIDLADPEDDIDAILSSHREQARRNVQDKLANQAKPKHKIAIAVGVSVLLLLIMILVWWSVRSSVPQTGPDDVAGSWVRIPSKKTGTSFGISFDEDGSCVVFNSNGDCWTGNYEWFEETTRDTGLIQSVVSMNSKVSAIPLHHYRDFVGAGDGCIRLTGESDSEVPMLGEQSIRVCFVRRDEEYLWLGYVLGVDVNASEDTLNAGWVQLWPQTSRAEFRRLGNDTLGTDLLGRYGVPNEARPLTPAEVSANSGTSSAAPRSLLRYGAERLTLFSDGSVGPFESP